MRDGLLSDGGVCTHFCPLGIPCKDVTLGVYAACSSEYFAGEERDIRMSKPWPDNPKDCELRNFDPW